MAVVANLVDVRHVVFSVYFSSKKNLEPLSMVTFEMRAVKHEKM